MLLVQEDTRTVWSWVVLEQLAQDIRYGLRTLIANETFSAMAILSLPLGIGANAAIFGMMDSILLCALPVRGTGRTRRRRIESRRAQPGRYHDALYRSLRPRRYNRIVTNTFDRITQNPNMLAGRATVRGLRISVAHVVNLVANGMTPAQIVADLPDLEEDDVRQALAYAAALAQDELHTLRA